MHANTPRTDTNVSSKIAQGSYYKGNLTRMACSSVTRSMPLTIRCFKPASDGSFAVRHEIRCKRERERGKRAAHAGTLSGIGSGIGNGR